MKKENFKKFRTGKREPLAVIGIGCRYPGQINTPEKLWDMICNKRDTLGPIPADRWDADALYAPEWRRAGKINVNRGGFIKDIEKFDAGFFGISPLEASRMDPQQRMLLEVSYELIEDAGIRLDDLNGSKTAVYIGISSHDYGDLQNTPLERINIGSHTNVGSALCITANRISYVYNLKGPSIALDTACSSSLTAIHLACQAIWQGEVDGAFAGGVNAILKPEPQMGFSKGGFLSPDGICYSFDERGNGYIRSEGAGLIFIKPLSAAEQAGDMIYGVIRGSSVNHDGTTKGISMPSSVAQQALLEKTYQDAGIDPHKVKYVETHGTGTFVGDPIESTSVGLVIGKDRRDYCYIGSIKSNIGHLEPASGVVGISKTLLALKNGIIPPNIHFKKGNPNIPFDEFKLKVATECVKWPGKIDEPRYAGVNSFGFGGSNAHVILQDYRNKMIPSGKDNGLQVCTISARNIDALTELVKKYILFIGSKKQNHSLRDICSSSTQRRSHLSHRLAIVAKSKKELADNLKAWLDGESINEVAEGRVNDIKSKIVFVFSGQGPQWWAMGRQLLKEEPLFRHWIEKLDKMLSKHADWSLLKELNKDESSSRISDTNIAQPSIFAIQIALYEMWKAVGIYPSAVVGHSIGEVAAGYVSGALTLEQAVLLIFHRSRVQFKATDKGRMLAVGLPYKEAKKLIAGKEDRISVGAVNGPSMVALSGDTDLIEEISEDLSTKDIFNKLLVVNVPFHSHHMEPLKEELISSLKSLKPKATKIPFYSTVEGKIVKGEKLTPLYWFRNVREPVYFTSAIEAQIDDGFDTFIELGPHPIHSIGINDLLTNKKKKGIVIASLRRKEEEKRVFLSALAHLYAWGCTIDWDAFYGKNNKFVKLPRYPWQQESFWLESEEGHRQRIGSFQYQHPFLQRKTVSVRESSNIIWDVNIDKRVYPFIADHKVQGPIVYPGAGHVDLIIGAARASFGENFCFLEDLNFENPLFLPESGEPPYIQIDISHDSGDYFVYSKSRKKDSQWTMCSNGKINHIDDKFKSIPIDIDEVRKRTVIPVPVKPMHDELQECGLYLGPTFRAIKKLWRSDGNWESLSEIEVHESIRSEFHQFNIHPGVLDSCFQTVFGIFNERDDVNKKMGIYVPRHIERIKFYNDVNSFKLIVCGRLNEWTDEYALGDLWIFNVDGTIVAEFQGFLSQYLKGSRGEIGGEQNKWFYEYKWHLKSRAEQEKLRNPGKYLANPSAIKKGVSETIKEICSRKEQSEYYEQYEPEQYKLTIGYICAALKELKLNFEKGREINPEELINEMNVVKEHHRLFHYMFKLLENAGFLCKEDKYYKVLKTPSFGDVNTWMDELQKKYPQFHHESTLLGRCGPYIKEVLLGEVDPIELIFPESQWDVIVQYYVEGFAFRKYNDIARRSVEELISKLPDDQTLRILEIGAGTGGMTQAILPLLPADRTEYVFTDLSHMFTVKAQQRFAKYPFVTYQILDIEKKPLEQGFDPNSYDLIIASDVIHATRNLKVTLGNISKLLASEGILLMLEVTNSPVYLDFIFGMTEGWWLFEDTDIRPKHATMSPEKWKKVLKTSGFTDAVHYSDFEQNNVSCQSVILARNPKLKIEKDQKENGTVMKEGTYLVFADNKGVSEKLLKKLAGRKKEFVIVRKASEFKQLEDEFYIDTLSQSQVDKVIDYMSGKKNFDGILFCWGFDLPGNDQLSFETIERAESLASATLMNIMKKLNKCNFESNPRIWVLFNGAQSVGDSPKQVDLSSQGLRGVAKVALNEFPNYNLTLVDFSLVVSETELDVFVDELFAPDRVDELAFRGSKRYVNVLERLSVDNIEQQALQEVPAEGFPYIATISEYGVLDNIVLRKTKRREPQSDEVEVKIKASALNFRDIMIAMGLLSDAAVDGGLFGRTFGLECSGVISAIGKNVKGLKIGEEVMATAPSCIAGFAYPKACHVVKKPKRLNWHEAASLPVVYTTAYFSLIHHCRLAKGEKILIHAAAGGVGIAAINIANAIGAEIYATVSSEDKRSYIEKLGVKPENIFNSRTLSFADELKEKLNGRGIDVVLNSLSGEAIYKSIDCLAPYGRFVEIGKTDIYRNSKLGLQPFGNNLTYFGVDVDRLFKQKEKFSGELFQNSIDYFVKNKFQPHPVTVFPVGRLADAFQFMGGARHIGKIIISMEDKVAIAPPAEISFKEDATYLITGGASGFGLAVAEWMTTKGCKHLALLSRSGTKTKEEEVTVEKMRSKGIEVKLLKGSVCDKKDIDKVFKELKKNMPPLKGIQHAAMVLDDCSIPEVSLERYMKVFMPKAAGCWLLHEASKDIDLDHFVCYSSISAIYGNPGQVSYVSGNTFLDNFSKWRRQIGLPATTINWGVIGDVGFVARSGNVGGLLYKQGWKAFSLQQATNILEQILLTNPVQRVATDSDWEMIGNFYPHTATSSRFEHLVKEKELSSGSDGSTSDVTLRATLIAASAKDQNEMLLSQLKETFARVLGTTANKLDEAEPVTKYGLDSLMANQIRNWIQSNLSVDYSMMRIMRGPTMEEMTNQILDELTGNIQVEETGVESRSELDKWILRNKKVDNPRLRIFCLPYFAGGASIFNSWHEYLPDDIEVCAIQLPGREERADEKAFNDVFELVKALAAVMEPLLITPIAFYSHSSGAGIALELARYLRKHMDVRPVHFFVGGWRAPHVESKFKFLDAIAEDEVFKDKNIPNIKGHLRSLEIPEEVLNNDDLFNEMLPSLRADILLGKRYHYYEDEPLDCPLTAFSGSNDTVFTEDQIKAWKKHTISKFSLKRVNGSHLFCRDNKEELLQMLTLELSESMVENV